MKFLTLFKEKGIFRIYFRIATPLLLHRKLYHQTHLKMLSIHHKNSSTGVESRGVEPRIEMWVGCGWTAEGMRELPRWLSW